MSKVDDGTITVKMSVEDAKAFVRDYPHSKYIKPALDKVGGFEAGQIITLGQLESLPTESIVLATANDKYQSYTVLHRTGADGWLLTRGGDGKYVKTVKIIDICSRRTLKVLHLPSGKKTLTKNISFDMPVEEARRIGGCILTPLVAEYDRTHAPKKLQVGDTTFTRAQLENAPVGTIITENGSNTRPRFIIMPNGKILDVDADRNQSVADYSYKNDVFALPEYWIVSYIPEFD